MSPKKEQKTEKQKTEKQKTKMRETEKQKAEKQKAETREAEKQKAKTQETEKQKAEKQKSEKQESGKKSRKFYYIAAGAAVIILGVYFAGAAYFTKHFLFSTEINGQDVSGMSLKDAQSRISGTSRDYRLSVIDKDDREEVITGSEIGFQYRENGAVEKLLKAQNPFTWIWSWGQEKSREVQLDISYDESLLKEKTEALLALQGEQTQPQNAAVVYNGESYEIQPEVYGTSVDRDRVLEAAGKAVAAKESKVSLLDEGCYIKPAYTAESAEVISACDAANKYVKASITYPMKEQVTVDRALISSWITVDGSWNVALNTEAMRQWLREFGQKYDTVGATRNFTTPDGKQTNVTGGTYGWEIDEASELVQLQNNISNGETVTREPAYCAGQTAAVHAEADWGNTYAEVDMSAQKMWYVQDGQVLLSTPVVTGEPIPSKITTEGVFTLLGKTRNSVLIGNILPETGEPEYEQPVSYWMPVTTSGIGFHDATWQSAFGGTLNQIAGIGSHGCINMPLDKAGALFEMIQPGTPVIFHY